MPTQKQKPSLFRTADGKSFLLPFVFITSLFLLWGFAHGLLDVLNKHFQGAFTMSKAESGLVQFVTYIAYFLMALPAGHFMKRFGYKKGILCGLALFGIGSFSFIPAVMFHSATPFLIALFVIACGLCFLETAANPYSTILGPPESGAQRLNLSQSFNGLGWILGPLIGGMLIFNAGDEDSFALARPYILIGIVVALVTLAFCFIRLPEIKTEVIREAFPGDAESQGDVPVLPLYKRPSFVRAVIAQFCYCAAQTGIFSFFINYVTEMDPQISNVQASQFLAFGGMALFMLGMASVGRISLYALYITFFFMSIMFPTIFALGLEGMGGQTKKASSYLVMSVAGGAFSPMLMGYIGETQMARGFIVPLLAFGYILYFAWKFKVSAENH